MTYIYIVASLAVLQFFFFGVLVGNARGKYKVPAPATSGNEQFDRIFRVQMNTMEQLLGFLPALFMCAQFWPAHYVAAIGLVYLVGRLIYWRSYLDNPKRRGLGFLLSFAPTILLLIGTIVGAIRAI